jgi:hypothetical protein
VNDQVFCELLRSRGAIRVENRTYRGELNAHVRFYFTDPHDGTLQPSPKGVALRPSEVRQVAEALLRAADAIAAEAEG